MGLIRPHRQDFSNIEPYHNEFSGRTLSARLYLVPYAA
jgi:hypothetical protein